MDFSLDLQFEVTAEQVCLMCHFASECPKCCKKCRESGENGTCYGQICGFEDKDWKLTDDRWRSWMHLLAYTPSLARERALLPERYRRQLAAYRKEYTKKNEQKKHESHADNTE